MIFSFPLSPTLSVFADLLRRYQCPELQDEQKWKSRFTTTTDDQWDEIAAMVRQEIATGETVPLSEIFPAEQ